MEKYPILTQSLTKKSYYSDKCFYYTDLIEVSDLPVISIIRNL